MFLKNQAQCFLIFIDFQTKIYHNQHMRYSDLISESNDPNDPLLKTIAKMAVEDVDRSAIWIDIQPDLTGFRTTFWVSCEPEYPYFIVDPTPGNLMYPTKACHAFHYWKSSTYPEIDAWMKKYKILLMKLLKQRISAKTFYMQLPAYFKFRKS